MNYVDKQLFEFFHNYTDLYHYTEPYKGNELFGSNITILQFNSYGYFINLIHKQSYSDINVQDNDGNTFLHYAFKYKVPTELINKLLLQGGNPRIKNNREQNSYDISENDFLNSFWRTMDFYKEPQNFINLSKTAHDDFKQDLFNYVLGTSFFRNLFTVSAHVEFLKDSDMYSPQNFIKFIFNLSTSEEVKAIHDEFLSMNPTPEDNSLYLLYIIKKGMLHLINNREMQETFLDFIENTEFASDVEAYGDCFKESIVLNYKNNDNTLAKAYKDNVAEKLIQSIFTIPREKHVYDYCENVLIVENPALKALYLQHKLHYHLKDTNNSVGAKKIKI